MNYQFINHKSQITKLFIIFSLLLSSCEKVLEFDEGMSQRQIVLNGVPSAGQELFVNLSYSHLFIDSNTSFPIADAHITVDVNGTQLTPVRHNGCNYFFERTMQEDDEVSISVLADGRHLQAHTYVPRLPRVADLQCSVVADVFNFVDVSFNLNDYPDKKDYYKFTIAERDSGIRKNPFTEEFDTIDTTFNTRFLCLFNPEITSPEVAASSALGGYFYNQLLTTDSLINGKNVNIHFQILLLFDTNEVEPFKHDYELHIESVTPERYDYLRQAANASSSSSLFSEPIQVSGNIEGGALGCFAGNAKRRFPLVFERPHWRPTNRR